MFNFKKYFVGLLGVSLFVCALATLLPLTGRGQGNAGGPPQFAQRKFYLTQTSHDGSQATTACAEGYHMASFWEIWDPSNFKYNTDLGFTQDDSGFGPPREFGWIRTGSDASMGAGLANCQAWTSADLAHRGAIVTFTVNWDSTTVFTISPWHPGQQLCSTPVRVWCVQD